MTQMIHNPSHSTSLLKGVLVGLAVVSLWLAHVAQAEPMDVTRIETAVRTHVQQALGTYLDVSDPATHVTITLGNIPGLTSAVRQWEATPDKPEENDLNLAVTSSLSDFYSERTLVRLRVYNAEGTARMLGVPVTIHVEKPVWVAKINVDAKQPLRRANFVLQSRDVSQDLPHTADNGFALNRYMARVTLRAGEPLDIRKVSLPPAVTRNSPVHIILATDGMNISVMGTAMGDAQVGERVRVKYKNRTQKYFTATVTDKNRVEVNL